MSAEENGLLWCHCANVSQGQTFEQEESKTKTKTKQQKQATSNKQRSSGLWSLFCLGFVKFLQLGLLLALCQVVVEEDEQREAVGQQNLHRESRLLLQPQEVISGLHQTTQTKGVYFFFFFLSNGKEDFLW